MVVAAGWAAPVSAQIGALRGKVVDEAGKPVADAEITFEHQEERNIRFTAKTNARGEWVRAGLRAVGLWTITVKKDDMAGRVTDIEAPLTGTEELKDVVIRRGVSAPVPPAGAGAAEDAARRTQEELGGILVEANAAMAAGNYDLVIAKFTDAAARTKTCVACYVRIGDAYLKKNDAAAAEKAYLSAIEVNGAPKDTADAYGALATLYNQQRKLADAARMSQKETELRAASGGGDATSIYNAGAILWNQGKLEEAKAQFAKAIELNPKMADAHYYLGMCLVAESKTAEAKASMEEYLRLAPNGPNAATAKAVLESLK